MTGSPDSRSLRARLEGIPDPVALLEGVIAHSPIPHIIFKADGHPLVNNRAYRDMFGTEPPPEYNLFQDEETTRSGLAEAVRKAFQGETIQTPTFWYDPKTLKHIKVTDAKRVATSCTFVPLVGTGQEVTHVAVVFKDVTSELESRERAEAERDHFKAVVQEKEQLAQALRESEERLRDTLDAVTVGTWEWNIAENRVGWSPNIERIFGIPPGTFGGTYEAWLALVHPEDREAVARKVADSIESKGRYETRLRIVRPDGSIGWQMTRGYVVLDEAGTPKLLRGLVLDETARHAAEEFEHHAVGIVSHDLRNPISAIEMSAAILLRRGNLDESQAKAVTRIVSSAERASRMIRDFLDFTRARLGGGIPIVPASADLHQLVRTVVDEVRISNPERAIEVRFQGNGRGSFDADRISQVVGNLVVNACQHSPPGAEIQVLSAQTADELVVELRNGGPPIPTPQLPDLFAPFKSGGGAQRSSGSVGLGLYIAQQIVHSHRGSLEVSSTPDDGTIFTVRLPLQGPRTFACPGDS